MIPTKDYKITLRHPDNLEVIRYLDSDFVRCEDIRRFIAEYIFLLIGEAILGRVVSKL